jgi:hypothetical protein
MASEAAMAMPPSTLQAVAALIRTVRSCHLRTSSSCQGKKHAMKSIYRLLAIACISVAGFSGCTRENGPVQTTDIEAAPQTTVVRYSAEDIAGLPLGEFLHFDLSRPNTIYALTYSNPADLDRVLVERSDDKYILGDRVSGTENAQGGALKEVVVSEDDARALEPIDGTVCNCPCCQLVDGAKVCC